MAGKVGGVAALVGFSSAVMTVSKTVLYCMCAAFGSVSVRVGSRVGVLMVWLRAERAFLGVCQYWA